MLRQGLRLLSVFAILMPVAAFATFHQVRMVEFFPGTVGSPNAQYITIQMIFNSERLINGQPLRVFDSAGSEIFTFIVPADLPQSSTTQPKYTFATSEAEALFGFTADFVIAPSAPISLAGGKICYGLDDFSLPLDCLAWGNFAGGPDGVGLPFHVQGSLIPGRSVSRRLDIAGAPNNLNFGDDTDNNDNDFIFANPTPQNYSDALGTLPASTCGDAQIDGLESCDDGGTANNDGCNSGCIVEFCGDGILQATETCDDGNGADTDDCSSACAFTFCGDGFVEVGVEECDDGNDVAGDGCDDVCFFEGLAGCGNGEVNGTEECDDGNLTDGDGCTASCANEFCGDGIINDGNNEDCDDGNTADNDGCSAACETEGCGDGVVQVGEECDDSNIFDADGCSSGCLLEVCGNGRVDAQEVCDDGNAEDGDGCNSICLTEPPGGGCACSVASSGDSKILTEALFLALVGVVLLLRRREVRRS